MNRTTESGGSLHVVNERPSGIVALTLIVAFNIIIYIDMCLAFGSLNFTGRQVLYYSTSLFGPNWHLIPSQYIHFGLIHVATNMAALIAWGRPVARRMGFVKFVLFYTTCGIVASVTSMISHPASTVAAGASGSISGVLGALFVIRLYGDKRIDSSELVSLVVANGLLAVVNPEIDWQAHVGGLVAGLILGIIFVPKYLLLILTVFAIVLAILVQVPT